MTIYDFLNTYFGDALAARIQTVDIDFGVLELETLPIDDIIRDARYVDYRIARVLQWRTMSFTWDTGEREEMLVITI